MITGFAYTYVIRLSNGDLYVGSTDDLERRMQQHIDGVGGRTTKISATDALYKLPPMIQGGILVVMDIQLFIRQRLITLLKKE